MFIATHTFVNESDDHLATMQIVNDLRASVVQAGDGARTAGLLRSAGIILPPSASAGYASRARACFCYLLPLLCLWNVQADTRLVCVLCAHAAWRGRWQASKPGS